MPTSGRVHPVPQRRQSDIRRAAPVAASRGTPRWHPVPALVVVSWVNRPPLPPAFGGVDLVAARGGTAPCPICVAHMLTHPIHEHLEHLEHLGTPVVPGRSIPHAQDAPDAHVSTWSIAANGTNRPGWARARSMGAWPRSAPASFSRVPSVTSRIRQRARGLVMLGMTTV